MKSPVSGARLRAMVPPGERWFAMLHAGLLKMGLPVRDCVLGGGRLTLRVGRGPDDMLTLVLDRAGDAPSLRLLGGGRWALSYRGKTDLGPAELRVLDVFSNIVSRLEARIPAGLEGFAAIVEEEDDPKTTLVKVYPFVTIEESMGIAGPTIEVLVRTISRCNHACPFCSAPPLAEPPFQIVRACIKDTAELLPGATLSLTGGEPTLKESFLYEARAALAEPGIGCVQIQTNAGSFANRLDPGELGPSPRLSFFVSLHAVDSEIFDLCTGTKGRLSATLAGIRRILDAGHRVTLNTVVSSANVAHMNEIAARLPVGDQPARVSWHLSALICPESNPSAADHLVSYSELVPAVLEATKTAMNRGIATSSLLSSTHAAVPPCVLPDGGAGDRRWLVGQVRSGSPDGGRDEGRRGPALAPDRIKAEDCRLCSEYERCPGVPKAYGLRFGLLELRPLKEEALGDEKG